MEDGERREKAGQGEESQEVNDGDMDYIHETYAEVLIPSASDCNPMWK